MITTHRNVRRAELARDAIAWRNPDAAFTVVVAGDVSPVLLPRSQPVLVAAG